MTKRALTVRVALYLMGLLCLTLSEPKGPWVSLAIAMWGLFGVVVPVVNVSIRDAGDRRREIKPRVLPMFDAVSYRTALMRKQKRSR